MDQTPGESSSQGAPRTSSHNADTPTRPSQQDGTAPLPLTRVSRPPYRTRRPPSHQQQQSFQQQQQPPQQRAGEGSRNVPPYWLRGRPLPNIGPGPAPGPAPGPSPGPAPGPYPQAEPLPLPMQGTPWVHRVEQQFSSTVLVQGNPMAMASGIPPISQLPWIQDPGVPTQGPMPSFGEIGDVAARLPFGDAAQNPQPMARPPIFSPEYQPPGSVGFVPPHFVPYAPPVFASGFYSYAPNPNQPPNQPPSQRPSQASASSSSRAPRSFAPQPTSFPPGPSYQHETPTPHASTSSDRRRPTHTRARRPANARYADSRREGSEGASLGPLAFWQAGRASPYISMDDPRVRQAMLDSDSDTNNNHDVMVVSSEALASLEAVDHQELPEQERTCVICYNDFGEESAEGITEVALRLPRCRHVFGDHCIRRWFQNSDSCPYCRNKLPSSPKFTVASLRSYLNDRARGGLLGMPEEMYSAIMGGSPDDGDHRERAPRGPQAAERRSLPDDTDSQRRIRPRRDSNENPSNSVLEQWRNHLGLAPLPAALTGGPTRERLERWLGTPPAPTRIQQTTSPSAQVAAANLAGDVVGGSQGSTSQAAPPPQAAPHVLSYWANLGTRQSES